MDEDSSNGLEEPILALLCCFCWSLSEGERERLRLVSASGMANLAFQFSTGIGIGIGRLGLMQLEDSEGVRGRRMEQRHLDRPHTLEKKMVMVSCQGF